MQGQGLMITTHDFTRLTCKKNITVYMFISPCSKSLRGNSNAQRTMPHVIFGVYVAYILQ